jgi:hypothetical protein
MTDWDLVSVRSEANEVTYVAGYRPSPGFQLSFVIERRIGFFVAKVIIPLILIVAMSWIVFWIDPEEGAVQINVAITSMLTLIAYRFAIGSTLPLVSYLTRLDYFILLATILVFASLMEVIIVVRMAKRPGALERARAIDRKCRWIFPGTFFVLGLGSLVLRVGS